MDYWTNISFVVSMIFAISVGPIRPSFKIDLGESILLSP